MDQTNTKLQDYPFDLYQRSRDIQEIVNIITRETGKEKLKILDVGGFRVDAEERDDLLLREFLPQANLVIYLSSIRSPMKEADRKIINKIKS